MIPCNVFHSYRGSCLVNYVPKVLIPFIYKCCSLSARIEIHCIMSMTHIVNPWLYTGYSLVVYSWYYTLVALFFIHVIKCCRIFACVRNLALGLLPCDHMLSSLPCYAVLGVYFYTRLVPSIPVLTQLVNWLSISAPPVLMKGPF